MRIHIKQSGNQYQLASIDQLKAQLSLLTPDSALPPYIIGYFANQKAHYLLTLSQEKLYRFPLKQKVDEESGQVLGYLPYGCRFEYSEKQQDFLSTPWPHTFTTQVNFLIPLTDCFSDAEIDGLSVTQAADKEEACPYLANSPLTQLQQKYLYFSSVIRACDTFHETIRTILAGDWGDPVTLLASVLQRDEVLVKNSKLSESEKKAVEQGLRPFFLPENINSFEGFDDIQIAAVLEFYQHCVRQAIALKDKVHNVPTADNCQYPDYAVMLPIGKLPNDYESKSTFWEKHKAYVDETLVSPNVEIIDAFTFVFDSNRMRQSISFRHLLTTPRFFEQLEHINHVIKQFRYFYLEPYFHLDMTSDYQAVYAHLLAAYPVPAGLSIRERAIKAMTAGLVEINKLLKIKSWIDRLKLGETVQWTIKGIAELLRMFPKNQLEQLMTDSVKLSVIQYLQGKRVFERLIRELRDQDKKLFLGLFHKQLSQGVFYTLAGKLQALYQPELYRFVSNTMLADFTSSLQDVDEAINRVPQQRKVRVLEAVIQRKSFSRFSLKVIHVQEIYARCVTHGKADLATQFINGLSQDLPRIVSTLTDLRRLLESSFSKYDKSDLIDALAPFLSNYIKQMNDVNYLMGSNRVNVAVKNKLMSTLLRIYNRQFLPETIMVTLFSSPSLKLSGDVAFMAGVHTICHFFENDGGRGMRFELMRTCCQSNVDREFVTFEIKRVLKQQFNRYPKISIALNLWLGVSLNQTVNVIDICQQANTQAIATPRGTGLAALQRPRNVLMARW